MIPTGTIVNVFAIIGGSVIGCGLQSRFSQRFKGIVFQGLGLCMLVIGIQMALKNEDILAVIFAIMVGGVTGEILQLDTLFEKIGNEFKKVIKSKNEYFTDGFIMASLTFCVGAMAIIGSLEEGINGDPTILYTKSILDGFASIALAASYGAGVIYSFLPVLLYQGSLTLGAEGFQQSFSDPMIIQVTACGGVLVMGIGVNLLHLTEINLANFLPALVYAVVLTALF